jgi:hypothetical protein
MMNVEEAKQWVISKLLAGGAVDCPVCEQRCEIYKRKLNSGMAVCLLVLVRAPAHKDNAGGWVHVQKYLADNALRPDVKKALSNREWAKLAYWGLLEEATPDVMEKMFEGAKNTGFWRLTEKGRDFAHRKVSVPEFIHLYDGEFLRFDGKPIDIEKALRSKFDYEELMRGS